MLQGLMSKLAAAKGAKGLGAGLSKPRPKMGLKSAFRSLAIKRKVGGKSSNNAGASEIDNSDQSY